MSFPLRNRYDDMAHKELEVFNFRDKDVSLLCPPLILYHITAKIFEVACNKSCIIIEDTNTTGPHGDKRVFGMSSKRANELK